MKKKISATLMAFLLVLQVISSGLLMPASVFAETNNNAVTTNAGTGTDANSQNTTNNSQEAAQTEEANKQIEQQAKQAVDSLFTNNNYTAIAKDVTDWRINSVEATVNKVTSEQVKKDLQDKIELARAFVAVGGLFTSTKDQLAEGVTQVAIDEANARVLALIESEGKNALKVLIKKAIELSEGNPVVSTNNDDSNSNKANKKVKQSTKSLKKLAIDNDIKNNILTDMKLNIDGKDYNSGDTIDNLINETTSNIHFEYKLPKNHGYTNGATFTFQLPSHFELYNAIPTTNLDGGYGKFSATKSGKVTVVFNENIATEAGKNGVEGVINFSSKIKANHDEGTEQKIEFTPIAGEKTFEFNVNFKKPTVPSKDSKTGALNQPFNPTSATWTVLLNSQNQVLNNGTIVDKIPAGMEFDNVLTITPMQLLMNGTLKELDPISITPDVSTDESGIQTLTFHVGKTSLGYKVSYKTKIVGDIQDTYTNKAFLTDTVDGNTNTVGKEQTKNLTPKKGVNFNKTEIGLTTDQQHIEWKVEFNGNQKSYAAGLKLKDLVDIGSFDASSLKAYKANVDPTTGTVSKTEEVVAGVSADQNGVITFSNAIDHQAIIMEYTTSINEANSDGGISNVKNSIGFYDENAKDKIKDYVTKTFSRSGTGINKTSSNPDYTNKTVTWTIDANSVGNIIASNSEFTDTFGTGLHYVPDSVKVSVGGSKLTSNDYEFVPTDKGFTLKLRNETTQAIKITYKTNFDLSATQNSTLQYKNDIQFKYENQFGNEITIKKDNAPFNPDQHTKDNGYKKGVYDLSTKRVTWTVGINYNLKEISVPIVTDTLKGEDKFTIDPDTSTFKLYKLTGVDNKTRTVVSKDDYKLEFSNDKKSFTLSFNNPINAAYEIEYQTTDDDNIYEGSYTNTANLSDGVTPLTTLIGAVNGKDNNGNNTDFDNYVEKTGVQDSDNPDYLNWTIQVNKAQSTVSNAIIEDTPQGYQILKEDSIKIYEMKVDGNKLVKNSSAQVSSDKYSVILDNETGTFTIKFKDTISKAYQVEYQTYFLPESNNGNISNKVHFKGDNIKTSEEPKSGAAKYSSSIAWGTSVAKATSLTIKKIDRNTQEILPGAKFTLYADEAMNTKMDTQTTGVDGTVKFYRLIPDRYYYLVEESAPNSYEKNRVIRVKAESDSSIVVDNVLSVNACTQFEIKYDAPKGVDLSKVEFDIYEGKKKLNLSPITVGNDGKLKNLPILEKGKTYKVIQTSGTPSGYDLVAQNITVDENCDTTLVTVTNKTTCPKQTIQVKKDDNTVLNNYTAIFTKLDGSDTKVVTSNDSKVTVPEGFKEGTYTVTIQGFGYFIQDVEPTVKDGCEYVVKVTATDKCEKQKITVVDKDGNAIKDENFIENSSFELVEKNTNEVKYKDLVIGEDGQLGTKAENGTFSPLISIDDGAYLLVQKSTPVGYKPITQDVVLDGTKCVAKVIIDLTITGAACGEFDITVVGTDGKTPITKINDYAKYIEGSKFKLVDKKGNVVKSDGIELSDLTINADGKIVDKTEKIVGSTDLPVTPGAYKLVQTSTPAGFKALDREVQVTQNGGCNAIVLVDTSEKELQCDKFEINYTGPVGSEFELRAADGTVTKLKAVNEGEKVVLKVIDTDNNTSDLPSHLDKQNYTLTQTVVPTGYTEAEQQTIEFKEGECISALTIVVKKCEDFVIVYNGPEGAEFTLTKEGEPTPTLELKAIKDKEGKVVIVQKDGSVVPTNLPIGDYNLKQTKTPAGYLTAEDQTVKVVDNAQEENGKVECVAPVIITPVYCGDLTITYTGPTDSTATFDLYKVEKDADGKETSATKLYTGLKVENGKVIVKDNDGNIVKVLEPGSYKLVQTEVPSGYYKAPDKAFDITEGVCFAGISVTNNRIPSSGGDGGSTPPTEPENPPTDPEKPVDPVVPEKPNKPNKPNKPDKGNTPGKDKKPNKDKNKKPNKVENKETSKDKPKNNSNNETTFKVTDKNNSNKFKDHEYKLVDKNGKTVASGLKVNKDGNIVVKGLPDGDYHLVKLPQTGTQAPLYAGLMGMTLIALGGYVIYRGRKKKTI